MTDVLLVVPPCASAALPILGPSILAAACRREGLECPVLYANLRFAARVGYGRYRRFALSCSRMHGEMLFAEAAWGAPVRVTDADQGSGDDAVTPDDFSAALVEVPRFVDDVADEIAAAAPRVVGFSSVFQQTVASVALAKAVRLRLPDAVLVLGGANTAQPMGGAIAEATTAFDLVVSGEADLGFVGLVRELLAGRRPAGRVVEMPAVDRLDEVPTPVFDDYFEQVALRVAEGRLPEGLPIALPFESSRGCWWGERSHCVFCGLNGTTIAMRAKSPERALTEIEELTARWGEGELRASDDLLPLRIQREVLPVLAERQPGRGRPLSFFYEVKASLKRKDLDLLASAGVRVIQAGVESMSTERLRQIAKGTTGPMNLAFLRDARAAGVDPLWNWMVAFPDDEREDYEAFLRLIPQIEHLRPPVALAPLRIDRYSPYHRDPAGFGITNVRPLPGMERVWPDGADLARIAYHFTGDLRSPYRDDPVLARRVGQAVDGWLAAWAAPSGPPVLRGDPIDGGRLRVTDTRRVAVQRSVDLSVAASALLVSLERPRSDTTVERDADPAALSDLLFRCLVLQHEDKLVSAVVRPEI